MCLIFRKGINQGALIIFFSVFCIMYVSTSLKRHSIFGTMQFSNPMGRVGSAGMAGMDVDSNTGFSFHGDKIREFTGITQFSGKHLNGSEFPRKPSSRNRSIATQCRYWAVMTSIFSASDAAVRILEMTERWCLVIVADTKTPKNYLSDNRFKRNYSQSLLFFLTVQEQMLWEKKSDIGAFIREIPLRHFGRKNIGFLYAIYYGAEYIFDFDDDNIIKLDSKLMPMSIVPAPEEFEDKVAVLSWERSLVLNPYPVMQSSVSNSWPRGFPLDLVMNSTAQENTYQNDTVTLRDIAIIQYLADKNPDVDAIHRLTKYLPMIFTPQIKYLVIPEHNFIPYNAQATLHTKPAFWALLLPVTVPGRVSDIWRSYFSQVIFPLIGLKVVVGPPNVIQERNPHNILADMHAEQDLYFKAGRLVEFLHNWVESLDKKPGIPEIIEKLWISLFERGYVEYHDIILLQKWIKALIACEYSFPDIIN